MNINKRFCKNILCTVLLVGSIIILYNIFHPNDYEGQANQANDYQKFTGKDCSLDSLNVCVPDSGNTSLYSESKCGISTGNASRECGSNSNLWYPPEQSPGGGNKRYTHEQCAKECFKKGKQNNWSKIWMSHGRKVGATDSQCTGKNDKCRCYCSNSCAGTDGKGVTGKAYRTYDLSKCPSVKNTCGNIPWAIFRNGKMEDGPDCPLVNNSFDINNAYDLCKSKGGGCAGFTYYKNNRNPKVCFQKNMDSTAGTAGSAYACYIKKSVLQAKAEAERLEQRKLSMSLGEQFDKDGCSNNMKFYWADEIVEGGDNPPYGRTMVKKREECYKRCIDNMNCEYYKYSNNGKCHIFKKPNENKPTKAYTDQDKICIVNRTPHIFTANTNTISCMSKKGEVVGTDLVGGITKKRGMFVKTKKQSFSVKGTNKITNDTKEQCHFNCFKNNNCVSYSWLPITYDEPDENFCKPTLIGDRTECGVGTKEPDSNGYTLQECTNICHKKGSKFISHGRKVGDTDSMVSSDINGKDKGKCYCYQNKCGNNGKGKPNKAYRSYSLNCPPPPPPPPDDVDPNNWGKCYHFDKTDVKKQGFRKFVLKENNLPKGYSVLNKDICIKNLRDKEIVKYTDILRTEFNNWPCHPLCKREKVDKNSISSKLKNQENILSEKIRDIRYHSAFILLNNSSNEEIKGIYMLDIDHWIKERKKYLFNLNKYKNDPNYYIKYSHKIVWVNQKNNDFKIIVDVTRDKDNILEDITKLRIVKNNKLYSNTDSFMKGWTDPSLKIHFLGWNKKQWVISNINMIRKIEEKIKSYNYCDEKMKGQKLWSGSAITKCYYPNTKKYNSKKDVTLSSIDTLSDQKDFLRILERCTSRDGGVTDCEILNSSLRFK